MSKKPDINKFKQDMRRGLGRCVICLKSAENIDLYKDAVLWGCMHPLAYDAQCEGAHSVQLYDMINCFSDKAPFLAALAKRLEKVCKSGSWDVLKCSEVLAFFAADGDKFALDTLFEMQKKLFDIIVKKRTRNDNNAFESYEYIAVALITNVPDGETAEKLYLSMVNKMGLIMSKSIVYKDETFDWFQASSEEKIGRERVKQLLESGSLQSPDIKKYFCVYTAALYETAENRQRRKQEKREGFKTPAEIYKIVSDDKNHLSARGYFCGIVNGGQTRCIKEIAQMYAGEKDVKIRQRLLSLFAYKDTEEYLDAAAVMADALSNDEALSKTAFEVLGKTKSTDIAAFALECAEKGYKSEKWLPALIKNYRSECKELLVNTVKGIKVDFNGGDWHGIFMDIRRMFEDEDIVSPPEELLFYIYEKNYCSLCRYDSVLEMDKRGILTKDILNECLYDSYDETRELAAKNLVWGVAELEI